MINVNNLKPGITFKIDEDPYLVLESQHSKQGRGQASVKLKVRNLLTGSIVNKTYTGGDKVHQAFISKQNMNFLYTDADDVFLMNQETFEQIELKISKVEWELNFLVEGSEIVVKTYESKVIGIELPKNVFLKVVESPQGSKGNSVTNPQKKAKLETNFEIDVPLFIKEGDIVSVSTETGKYIGRG